MGERWIAVVGQGRGGTSPLFYAIVDALRARGDSVLATYEKYSEALFSSFEMHAGSRWVVAKFLTNHKAWSPSLVGPFPRRIQIVRDPRDSIVSATLFSAAHLATRRRNPVERLERWLGVVRAKEADPTGVDFRLVYEEALRALGRDRTRLEAQRWVDPMEVHRAIDPVTIRLEELSGGDPTASSVFGLALSLPAPPPGKEHVLRAGSSTWRHWFTPNDVIYFRPRMLPFMEYFGYPDEWSLEPSPRIDPSQSSLYATRTFEQIRERTADLEDPERRFEVYRHRAAHGDVKSAYRLADNLVRQGKSLQEARELAVLAACGGVRRAQVLVAKLCADGVGGPQDAAAAEYWSKAARASRGNRVPPKELESD